MLSDCVGNGQYGHDIVSLGYPGSGGPTLSNQVVAGIATPDFWLGIFGKLCGFPVQFIGH